MIGVIICGPRNFPSTQEQLDWMLHILKEIGKEYYNCELPPPVKKCGFH